MTPRPGRGGRIWLLCLAAPAVWFAHFSALYGVASFGEAAGLNPAWFDIIAWAVTVVACLAVALVWRLPWRVAVPPGGPAHGVNIVAGGLALLSLVGILFQGLVLAIVPP